MGEKKCFQTEKAAVTGGPYSQAVILGDLIYISGQVAVDPVTNKIRPGTIEKESELLQLISIGDKSGARRTLTPASRIITWNWLGA